MKNTRAIISLVVGISFIGTMSVNARISPTEIAVRKALDYLSSAQKDDGSWSDGEHSLTTTALAYLAFSRHGESRMSERYGKTVKKAEEWLTAYVPKTDTERVAVSIALTDYLRMNSGAGHKGNSVREAVGTSLREAAMERVDAAWLELLAVTVLPEGIVKPDGVQNGWELTQRYLKQPTPSEKTGIEDYFGLLMLTIAKFHAGHKPWRSHHAWYAKAVPQAQEEDGSFDATGSYSRTQNTALAAIGLEIYYAFAPAYDIREPKPKSPTGNDRGLEIE